MTLDIEKILKKRKNKSGDSVFHLLFKFKSSVLLVCIIIIYSSGEMGKCRQGRGYRWSRDVKLLL